MKKVYIVKFQTQLVIATSDRKALGLVWQKVSDSVQNEGIDTREAVVTDTDMQPDMLLWMHTICNLISPLKVTETSDLAKVLFGVINMKYGTNFTYEQVYEMVEYVRHHSETLETWKDLSETQLASSTRCIPKLNQTKPTSSNKL